MLTALFKKKMNSIIGEDILIVGGYWWGHVWDNRFFKKTFTNPKLLNAIYILCVCIPRNIFYLGTSMKDISLKYSLQCGFTGAVKQKEKRLYIWKPPHERLTVDTLLINHYEQQQGTRRKERMPFALGEKCLESALGIITMYHTVSEWKWNACECLCWERSFWGSAMLRWTIKTCISLHCIHKRPIWAPQRAVCFQAASLRAKVHCGRKVSEGMCGKDRETETNPYFNQTKLSAEYKPPTPKNLRNPVQVKHVIGASKITDYVKCMGWRKKKINGHPLWKCLKKIIQSIQSIFSWNILPLSISFKKVTHRLKNWGPNYQCIKTLS